MAKKTKAEMVRDLARENPTWRNGDIHRHFIENGMSISTGQISSALMPRRRKSRVGDVVVEDLEQAAEIAGRNHGVGECIAWLDELGPFMEAQGGYQRTKSIFEKLLLIRGEEIVDSPETED